MFTPGQASFSSLQDDGFFYQLFQDVDSANSENFKCVGVFQVTQTVGRNLLCDFGSSASYWFHKVNFYCCLIIKIPFLKPNDMGRVAGLEFGEDLASRCIH
jgi:hypothetical protein